MSINFEGRVAIVTGAGNGLGRSHALALAERGAKVVVNDLGGARDGTGASSDAAMEVVGLIEAAGGEAFAHSANVAKFDEVEDMVKQAMDKWGRVDILINNAGIATKNHPHDPPDQLDTQEMIKIFSTNVGGTCLVTQSFLPILKAAENPRCLSISSFLGSISKNEPSESNFYMATSYRCSKSALNQLMKCFALSIPEVTFLAVSPGHVQTDMGNASGRTAPLTTEEVADQIAQLSHRTEKAESGKFMDFKGEIIPY